MCFLDVLRRYSGVSPALFDTLQEGKKIVKMAVGVLFSVAQEGHRKESINKAVEEDLGNQEDSITE